MKETLLNICNRKRIEDLIQCRDWKGNDLTVWHNCESCSKIHQTNSGKAIEK
jgi:hypothetical protein